MQFKLVCSKEKAYLYGADLFLIFKCHGYQCIRNVLALYPSAILISIVWVVISEVLILILSKSNAGRKIFLGVG